MHYHTYNTPGFILGSTPSGEASRYVYIFTRDLGLVGAHAQNTRHVKSKLRYALDAPARSHVSLVRGKNMWRLISAVPDKNFYPIFKNNSEKQMLCARTFSLIKKLLAGEEVNAHLFSAIDDFLNFLEKPESDALDMKNIEAIILLRILHVLGYVPESVVAEKFAKTTEWTPEIVTKMTAHRKEAVRIINESLQATGL